MRITLNADGIDESEWLGRGHPAINAFRNAKNDVRHSGTQITAESPQDRMVKMQVIDDGQKGLLLSVQALHMIAFGHVNGRISSHTTPKHDLGPLDIYVRLMRQMRPQQGAMVRRLSVEPIQENDYKWIWNLRHNIQESIEAAIIILESIYETSNNENITKPEVSPK